MHPEDVGTGIMTLTKFIIQQQAKVGAPASGDFTILLQAIQFTCKVIANNIRRASLVSLLGVSGTSNATGDNQKKLDVISNDIFIENMKACGKVGLIVSEEEDQAIIVTSPNNKKYAVVCDPIDGSSNLDAGVSVGTIFGIYRLPEDQSVTEDLLFKSGRNMLCAGYCMYAASANLVLTTLEGVQGFTLDNALGEFILTHPDIQIPIERRIYSINEGNSCYFNESVINWLREIKKPADGSKPYSSRYIGSMVADMHRTLLYGGIFAYPADRKSRNGKLRLLYECFPMAMLVERAGGMATNGSQDILDLVPDGIHDRSGIFLGSKKEVEKILGFIKDAGTKS